MIAAFESVSKISRMADASRAARRRLERHEARSPRSKVYGEVVADVDLLAQRLSRASSSLPLPHRLPPPLPTTPRGSPMSNAWPNVCHTAAMFGTVELSTPSKLRPQATLNAEPSSSHSPEPPLFTTLEAILTVTRSTHQLSGPIIMAGFVRHFGLSTDVATATAIANGIGTRRVTLTVTSHTITNPFLRCFPTHKHSLA